MVKPIDKVVCTCNESGVHYPCPVCGKLHEDELDAAICCLDECLDSSPSLFESNETFCNNCPCGKADYDRRMLSHGKEDAEDFHWCEKTGGKVYIFGRCEDAYSEEPLPVNPSKKKRRNKRERDSAYKAHLKRLHETCNGYPSPVWYKTKGWVPGYGYVELSTPYYKRIYRGGGNKRGTPSDFFKKFSNRQVRRYNGELHNGGAYKKVFDYWWNVI